MPEKTIYRWVDERDLPVHRVHGQFRFNRAELLEWATRHGVRVSAALFPEPEVRGRAALDAARARSRPAASTRSRAEATGVGAAAGRRRRSRSPTRSTASSCSRCCWRARSLGSTAVGDGIAIPHVRNPVLLHVRPAVALCFLDEPIPFGALDGKPVDTLFVIVTPTSRSHLQPALAAQRRPARRRSSAMR